MTKGQIPNAKELNHMKLPILLFCAVLTIQSVAHAQVITWGDTGDDVGYGVTHDANGNVFLCGSFEGTVDFDPSDGPDGADTFTAVSTDAFIASYTTAGVFRFALHLTGSDLIFPYIIDTDTNGNIFVCGAFGLTVDFDAGPGTQDRTADNDGDGFLASYSNTGAFRFAHVLGGPDFTGCFSVSAAANGNILVVGGLTDTVDLDPSAGSNVFTAGGPFDGYVAGFSNTGTFQFASQMSGDVSCYNVAADASGNSFVIGDFEGTADFDASDGQDAEDTRTSVGDTDMFLASYSPTGALRFVYRLGGTGTDEGLGVATDHEGNCYITGFAAGVDFDPGPGETDLPKFSTTFLTSYSNTGALRFAVGAEGGSGGATAYYVNHENGNVFIGGRFRGVVDLAPGDPQARGLLDSGGVITYQGFVACYAASNGAIRYARAFGNEDTSVTAVSGTPDGSVAVIGDFEGTADFDPGFETVEKTSAGGLDAYLMTLDPDGYYPGSFIGGLEVTNTSDSGWGSLRRAIEVANVDAVPDTITFAIPGSGPHVITPLTPLPEIENPVEIDGFSQPGSSDAAWPPTLKVVIDGSSAGTNAHGLSMGHGISSDRFITPSSIRGLVLRNFNRYGFSLGRAAKRVDVTQCFVGVDPDGATAAPNAEGGILVDSANILSGEESIYGIHIGLPNAGNLISGNGGSGVFLDSSHGISVRGNFIGTTANGTAALPNARDGILVSADSVAELDSDLNRIGGEGAGNGNRIAYNLGDGVALGLVRRTDVLGNSISDNAGLGIDLFTGELGPLTGTVWPNDMADTDDDAPNDRINYPVLRSAILHGGITYVVGELDATQNERFRMEFFSSAVADPSGHGEGDVFLGSMDIHTKHGMTMFLAELPPVATGRVISATCTSRRTLLSTFDGTSEFSMAVPVVAANVTSAADSGPGSLRAAITAANASPGAATITLSPDLIGQTILLATELPVITNSLTLRGFEGVKLMSGGSARVLAVDADGKTVTLSDLIITGGTSSQNGGGILLSAGTLNLERCIISNSTSSASGGGLAIQAGTAILIDCWITDCSAQANGGGIAKLGGTLTMNRCTIHQCMAGAASAGGGIYVSGSVIMSNSTFSANTAGIGGGLHFTAPSGVRVEFCTVVYNSATNAGGIFGTIYNRLDNNIIAMNTAQTNANMPHLGAYQAYYDSINMIGGDPLIGPLRNNGGWVPTHALLTNSPARDQVSGAGDVSGVDARWAPRRNSSTTVADYGAFEYFTGPYSEYPRNYADWASSANAGAANADDNNDGLLNLAAHYLGEPVSEPYPSDGGIMWTLGSGPSILLSYSSPFSVIDSQAGSEVGSTIFSWTNGPPPVEVGSSTSRRYFEVTIPKTGDKGFARFRVDE